MRVSVSALRPGTAPGQIFLAPYSGSTVVGQTGALILGDGGDPVWFRPLPSAGLQNAGFTVQNWHDPRSGAAEPVLTWWQGSIVLPSPGGDGSGRVAASGPVGRAEPGGCYYVYDSSYRLRRTVTARNGFHADQHEFLLTSRGTALFLASRAEPADLRPYGGPADGAILNSEVQEVDLATGALVFSWNVREHVDPADSEVPAAQAWTTGGLWDPYHLNSIDEGPDGQLLVSSRNMSAVYAVDRAAGDIRWQLGGRRGDFTFGAEADFSWQHDVRWRPDGRIGLFDNGCCGPAGQRPQRQSRGVVLRLDAERRTATLDRSYYHRPALSSASQGNLQALSNGNEFVGWGQQQFYSEYAGAGNGPGDGARSLRYDARMPGENVSYRVLRHEWVGTPHYPPSLAVRRDGGQSVAYASWNGSTLTRAWQVLAGPDPGSLGVVVEHAMRTGFETAVGTADVGPYFQVRALDAERTVLSASAVVRLDG
ncbi:hypothetical protein D2L64_02190 [Micromonospora radicis]|uniref:ArsR family transcriptional regulator n=2 Tax=Micromonospora radicis TaxID=1894971 RepID=A0A418N225_9ACTN|nr:hypothetical protein D2L64_02190 [Micromonospora radicis]